MTTVSELRAQLTNKSFQLVLPTAEQQAGLPKISLHIHPLVSKPILLIGEDSDGARDYQTALISDATKRK